MLILSPVRGRYCDGGRNFLIFALSHPCMGGEA